jgi:hypothetical protein
MVYLEDKILALLIQLPPSIGTACGSNFDNTAGMGGSALFIDFLEFIDMSTTAYTFSG